MNPLHAMLSRLPILTLLLMACAPASAWAQTGSPAPPPCNGGDYRAALSDGRWQDALAAAERCYVDADRRGRGQSGITFDGAFRVGYRFYAAQLLAWSGRIEEAEATVRSASSLSESIGFGMLVPTAEIIAITEAFIRERSGAVAEARARYARLNPDMVASLGAAGRAALLALDASDRNDARSWGRLGDQDRDPTAQYVLGALAEASGDRATARSYYQAALASMAYHAAHNPGTPLRFLERDRIRAALARLPD